MPRLWTETIATHRREVRDAILEAAAGLVSDHGLRGVTMSQIAEHVGIGRATLYKYFPDVEAILLAWHERHVSAHLARLTQLRDSHGPPLERLESVLLAYAEIQQQRHAGELSALLHRDQHASPAQRHLHQLLKGLLIEAARTGEVRDDVPADDLASYCIHALSAAAGAHSKTAVRSLVSVTLTGLRN